ncbi:MAG: addiction module protein [Terracidiphilus sp.]
MKVTIPAAGFKTSNSGTVSAETRQRITQMMEGPKHSIVEAAVHKSIDIPDRVPRIRSDIFPAHAEMVAELNPRYNLPMSPNAQRLLEEARQLPPDEQEWLAEFLLIKDERAAADVESAWGDEIKRRLDEIDSGAVKMIPGDEVLARMDARLKARRKQAARRG